ncbi:heart- and neural crest derivatives-expressed protein 1-like [Brevipalpus obovatus]|uniref:heart- and neural crest derivatives-expressed protein 1-like n=1 Tax=Brevipalpus obovatus TaxID=246614 RepID=UPI003D9EA956
MTSPPHLHQPYGACLYAQYVPHHQQHHPTTSLTSYTFPVNEPEYPPPPEVVPHHPLVSQPGYLGVSDGSYGPASYSNYYTHHQQQSHNEVVIERMPKKRGTANKKERKRTVSINSAFSLLRDRIPNVPPDTKLSKIKTLRLATDYIKFMMHVLEHGSDRDYNGHPLRCEDFKVDLQRFKGIKCEKDMSPSKHTINKDHNEMMIGMGSGGIKRSKGRTGWPQHVWALELKRERVDSCEVYDQTRHSVGIPSTKSFILNQNVN